MSYRGLASPYLLELGLTKTYMSMVFLAGPLSGLIVQPLIGPAFSLQPAAYY
jgi:solute carrier family 45, member 1/2/4